MPGQGLRIGIEAKIEYNPLFDIWGDKYESIRRTGLNQMQRGLSEDEIEKSYQSRFDIQWGWADSIANEVRQTYKQLTTAKRQKIARLTEQIKKKHKRAKAIFKSLSKIKVPTPKQRVRAWGLKSKILKILSLKKQLKQLESTNRF